jgi:DNA-binding transcriptional MerR regulator
MENQKTNNPLQPVSTKRYFTIGEVGELCGVKPHVLRYWEQEFAQLKPVKRRGNRRYYQHQEIALIRRIKELLYDHGFTINGARNHLEQAENRTIVTNGNGTTPLLLALDLSHIRHEISSIVSQLRA